MQSNSINQAPPECCDLGASHLIFGGMMSSNCPSESSLCICTLGGAAPAARTLTKKEGEKRKDK